MSEAFDLVIRNAQVMTPGGLVEADIGILGGKIAAIGALADALTPRYIFANPA